MKREVRLSVITPHTPSPMPLGAFAAGAPVRPFGVGTGGEWRVTAPGVAAVHVYLCFDGSSLFVASVAGGEPAYLDGAPLTTRWAQVPERCTITCGQAHLVVEAVTMETAAPLPPWQAEQTLRLPPKRAVLAEPLDGPTVIVKEPAAAKPGARELLAETLRDTPKPSPSDDSFATTVISPAKARPKGEPPIAAAQPSSPGRSTVTARRPGAVLSRLRAEWIAAPPARRAIMILGPIALLAFGATELRAPDAPPPLAVNVIAPAHDVAPPPPAAKARAAAADSSPTPPAPSAARAAADAVAQGDFAGAAPIYESLAAASPGSRVYTEAARIARRKAGGVSERR
jgi:hypothetical protein